MKGGVRCPCYYIGVMRMAMMVVLLTGSSFAPTAIQRQIRTIAADAQGKVSVSCSLPDSALNCDLNPHAHPPMQSVFKFPLALTALHLVDQGKLSLDRPVRFLAGDRILPKTYSPLQDKYPEANVDIPLRELLRLAVSFSDNAAADVVLRTIGGPTVVDTYIKSIGVKGFHLEDDEQRLHRDPAAQYRNWFEPAGAVQLLRRISDRSPLTPESTRILLEWMEVLSHRAAPDQRRTTQGNNRDAQNRLFGYRGRRSFRHKRRWPHHPAWRSPPGHCRFRYRFHGRRSHS